MQKLSKIIEISCFYRGKVGGCWAHWAVLHVNFGSHCWRCLSLQPKIKIMRAFRAAAKHRFFTLIFISVWPCIFTQKNTTFFWVNHNSSKTTDYVKYFKKNGWIIANLEQKRVKTLCTCTLLTKLLSIGCLNFYPSSPRYKPN